MVTRWPMAWRCAWQRVQLWPALGTAALLLAAWLVARWSRMPLEGARLLELAMPLGVMWQAAFLFSPADEAPLEVMVACPRPLRWLLAERALLVALMQGSVALLATLLLGEGWLTVGRWLTASVLLGTLAVWGAQATRQGAFGLLVALTMWGVMWVQGDALVARWSFLQPLHLFLDPHHVPLGTYGLNRATLWGVTLLVAAITQRGLHDEERLLGARGWQWPALRPPHPLPLDKESVA